MRTVSAGSLDLGTDDGQMVARMLGAAARKESDSTAARIRAQKAQARAAGRFLGGNRAFGWQSDGLTPRPSEADELAAAAQAILSGTSLRSTAADLNGRGIATASGGPWNTSKVRQVLMRERTAKLIGDDTHAAVTALLSDPSRLTHRGVSRVLLGSHLFTCGECGAQLVSGGQTKGGKGRYRCADGHLQRVAEPIDRTVIEVVGAVLDRDRIELLPRGTDLAPLRSRAAVQRAKLDEIADAFADGELTREQVARASERARRNLAETETAIGRLSAGSALAGVADAAEPSAALRALDLDRQRAVIDTVVAVRVLRGRPGRGPFDLSTVRSQPRSSSTRQYLLPTPQGARIVAIMSSPGGMS